MLENYNNDTMIVISLGELRELIAERVKEARLDEIKLARPLGHKDFFQQRVAFINKGCCSEDQYIVRKKASGETKRKVTMLTLTPEQFEEQFIVRKR